jgi:hypothetical protein
MGKLFKSHHYFGPVSDFAHGDAPVGCTRLDVSDPLAFPKLGNTDDTLDHCVSVPTNRKLTTDGVRAHTDLEPPHANLSVVPSARATGLKRQPTASGIECHHGKKSIRINSQRLMEKGDDRHENRDR